MRRSEWNDLRRKLEKAGYTFVMGGKGHWKVYDGRRLVTVMPSTTSDVRAIRNKSAELRRRGIVPA